MDTNPEHESKITPKAEENVDESSSATNVTPQQPVIKEIKKKKLQKIASNVPRNERLGRVYTSYPPLQLNFRIT